MEQSGEDVLPLFKGHYKGKRKDRVKAASWRKSRCRKRSISVIKKKFLEENPEMQEKDHSEATVAEKTAKAAYQTRDMQKQDRRAGQTARAAKGNSGEVRESFTAAARKIQRRIASKMFRFCLPWSPFSVLLVMIMTASIFLWGDVCRRNQYHASRKLYGRSGRRNKDLRQI